jgi:hypothetical protein
LQDQNHKDQITKIKKRKTKERQKKAKEGKKNTKRIFICFPFCISFRIPFAFLLSFFF